MLNTKTTHARHLQSPDAGLKPAFESANAELIDYQWFKKFISTNDTPSRGLEQSTINNPRNSNIPRRPMAKHSRRRIKPGATDGIVAGQCRNLSGVIIEVWRNLPSTYLQRPRQFVLRSIDVCRQLKQRRAFKGG